MIVELDVDACYTTELYRFFLSKFGSLRPLPKTDLKKSKTARPDEKSHNNRVFGKMGTEPKMKTDVFF